MARPRKALLVRRISLFALSFGALSVSACSHPSIHRSISTEQIPSLDRAQSGDRGILAGEWEYEEGGAVVLTLDEQGNGLYVWQDGRIETQSLDGLRWQGMWFQKENDREGGFMVEFLPDFSEGNGTWWYTRIGSDHSPAEKGGTFHVIRKSPSAEVSETPPAP